MACAYIPTTFLSYNSHCLTFPSLFLFLLSSFPVRWQKIQGIHVVKTNAFRFFQFANSPEARTKKWPLFVSTREVALPSLLARLTRARPMSHRALTRFRAGNEQAKITGTLHSERNAGRSLSQLRHNFLQH